jgi:hypothetical protein
MLSRHMNPSPIFHRLLVASSMGYFYGSVLSSSVREISCGRERTAIELRYRATFLATSWASLLRVTILAPPPVGQLEGALLAHLRSRSRWWARCLTGEGRLGEIIGEGQEGSGRERAKGGNGGRQEACISELSTYRFEGSGSIGCPVLFLTVVEPGWGSVEVMESSEGIV